MISTIPIAKKLSVQFEKKCERKKKKKKNTREVKKM